MWYNLLFENKFQVGIYFHHRGKKYLHAGVDVSEHSAGKEIGTDFLLTSSGSG
jgi:hypothetical protein